MLFTVLFVILAFAVGVISGFSAQVAASKKAKSRVYDGSLRVSETDTKLLYELEFTTAPEQLASQKEVTFRIDKVSD